MRTDRTRGYREIPQKEETEMDGICIPQRYPQCGRANQEMKWERRPRERTVKT